MRKERTNIPVRVLELNTGQVDWLPKNPRTWTEDDVRRTEASIQEDPDFLDDRPLLVVPKGHKFIAFAGNLRLTACRKAGIESAPCIVYHPETDEDHVTVVRRAMKDNGSFGSWDFDTLANEWGDLPLTDWGVPVWEPEKDWKKDGLSTEGREGAEGYDAFVEKFEQKLTTDDCYTPPAVFDVVQKFVDENVAPLKDRKIIRPFFPGGNYEDLSQYPEGCIVLDNPPFSILSKILRFYAEHRIDFFLFGPHLTLFSASDVKELTYLPVCAPVTYENGAVVSTGFITNMTPGLKIWIPAGFRHAIREVQRDETPIDEYLIPPCVVTSSRLGTVAGVKGCEVKIMADECLYIKNLDAMDQQGKGLYGGGYLITPEKAEMIEKEKEKEKEKRTHTFLLSDREKAIVESLKTNGAQLSTDTDNDPQTAE